MSQRSLSVVPQDLPPQCTQVATQVDIEASLTVSDLKANLSPLLGLAAERIQLAFRNIVWNDNQTIHELASEEHMEIIARCIGPEVRAAPAASVAPEERPVEKMMCKVFLGAHMPLIRSPSEACNYIEGLLRNHNCHQYIPSFVKASPMNRGRTIKCVFNDVLQSVMQGQIKEALQKAGKFQLLSQEEMDEQLAIDKQYGMSKESAKSAVGDMKGTRDFLNMVGNMYGQGGSDKKRRRMASRLSKSFATLPSCAHTFSDVLAI
eukprot:12403936-Karenia_brevis.AAC.1